MEYRNFLYNTSLVRYKVYSVIRKIFNKTKRRIKKW